VAEGGGLLNRYTG